MFTADDIHARVHQRPFVPMRIITSGGQTYDIYHPDLVMVGRRSITVGTASSENPLHYDQTTRIAVLRVTVRRPRPGCLVSVCSAPLARGHSVRTAESTVEVALIDEPEVRRHDRDIVPARQPPPRLFEAQMP